MAVEIFNIPMVPSLRMAKAMMQITGTNSLSKSFCTITRLWTLMTFMELIIMLRTLLMNLKKSASSVIRTRRTQLSCHVDICAYVSIAVKSLECRQIHAQFVGLRLVHFCILSMRSIYLVFRVMVQTVGDLNEPTIYICSSML